MIKYLLSLCQLLQYVQNEQQTYGLSIEPMITLGSREVVMERDGWTVRTVDRKYAAHFEHTVAVGIGKADILSSCEYIEEVLKDKLI